MSAPKLTHLLVLEAASRVPDGAGGFTSAWAEVCQHWAEITPGTGRQTAGEEVFLAQVPYRITLRAAPVGNAARPRPEQRLRLGAVAVIEPQMADAAAGQREADRLAHPARADDRDGG
ncbi:MAG: head-tail adaptor protein, partial [Cypionkella sp.]